eukprot:XP_001694234.1 predicted protein [Chlamydomonas reinhardtii]
MPSQQCPDAVDNRRFLPPIENQGSCGCCWAFGATAAIEAAVGKLLDTQSFSLSKQQVATCLYSTAQYPFTGLGIAPGPAACRTSSRDGIRLRGYVGLVTTESAMFKALCSGVPALTVIVNACPVFARYSGGVFNTDCPEEQQGYLRQVALVGYGTDAASGMPYWLIRNSWGTWWGETGYVRIQRGRGLVGLLSDNALYPLIDAPNSQLPLGDGGVTLGPCATNRGWIAASSTAALATDWGKWWAVAVGTGCSLHAYASNAADSATAEAAARSGCQKVYAAAGLLGGADNCRVLASGQAGCNAEAMYADKFKLAKSMALNASAWGTYYSVAWTSDCATSAAAQPTVASGAPTAAAAEAAAVAACNQAAPTATYTS